ncbi:ABC transporter ATP-binding protein [Streptomyces sp. NBC_00236]|uniref:ABC transporter ATP-binding protein n=1 Tax=Streptomyces sp. NBC_00236 TaxID=2903639 RepID=UPI002E2AA3DA|nr:ABC transporter ATP-binding protein [Streptomyces sp. NBC_00236]
MRQPARPFGTVLSLALRFAWPQLAGVVLISLTLAQLPVLVAWLMSSLIDMIAQEGGTPAQVTGPALAMAVAGLALAVLPHVETLLRGELSRRVALAAQDRLYAAVNGWSGLGRFEDPAMLDRLRLAQQCGQQAPPQVVMGVMGLLQAVVTVLGFLGSLALVSWWLVAAVSLAAGPALVVELRMARIWADTELRVTPLERREWFYSNLLGSVQAAKEIRLFGTGDHLRARMRRDRRAINRAHRTTEMRNALLQGLPAALSGAIAALGLLWAVREAARGAMSVGEVSLTVAAMASVQGSFGTGAAQLAVVRRSLLLFAHFTAVVQAPPDLPVLRPAAAAMPARLGVGIELRDVWFRYSDQHDWALRGVSLTVPAGSTLALVGDNGAGKSTLVKLLCRFYDPTRGTVLWDGQDIRTFPPAELRRRMSAVFQDFMRYDVSAAENIGLGDGDDASRHPDRIRAAARRAGVDRLLEGLPRGYGTLLSRAFTEPSTDEGGDGEADDGVELSGGQWQRVALARSLLREDPDVLILDEPASGLDPQAEDEVRQALRCHRRGRTSILVSHRLGTAREADRIVVLRDGCVVEQGSHEELMARTGRYADLFGRQAAGYRESERPPAPPAQETERV